MNSVMPSVAFVGKLWIVLVWLRFVIAIPTAHTHSLPTSLPPGASYVYTTPALYLNVSRSKRARKYSFVNLHQLTVKTVLPLGNLSTGGVQLLGDIVSGHLYSEPAFELQFSGRVGYAEDYLTGDPGNDSIARPACVGTIFPDDGATPFLFRIGGIDTSSAEATGIFTGQSRGVAVPYGHSYSVWVPSFFGGYSVLQNSIVSKIMRSSIFSSLGVVQCAY